MKCQNIISRVLTGRRPPRRGRGLKLFVDVTHKENLPVAPLAGGVD